MNYPIFHVILQDKERFMRRINAKGVWVLLAYCLILAIALLFFGIKMQEYGGIGMIISSMILILYLLMNGRMLYKKHWIMYGNNKIIVSRFTKKIEERKKFGKWKTKVDEFSVDDIQKCGSSITLGKKVEWHWSNGNGLYGSSGMSFEYSFILKDGREIGFEGLYFTKKQKEELSNYILEKTGIKAAEYKLK